MVLGGGIPRFGRVGFGGGAEKEGPEKKDVPRSFSGLAGGGISLFGPNECGKVVVGRPGGKEAAQLGLTGSNVEIGIVQKNRRVI
jgi:hypothetical protein